MSALIVDSHCHLDYKGLVEQVDAVVARAHANGVGLMLSISTAVSRFPDLLALVEQQPSVFITVGTHPHHAHEEVNITVDELLAFTHHAKVVGIGEAGLDYHYDFSPRADQEKSFRTHIAAARQSGLPLVIHAREADDDMARILRKEMAKGPFKPLLHCFTASQQLAETCVELGGYVSFSGILTYKTAENLRQIAKALPIDRLLVETDAPYLAPLPHRGQSNEPAFVRNTLEVLAKVRGETVDDMARITSDNFFRLFSKVPRPSIFSAAA